MNLHQRFAFSVQANFRFFNAGPTTLDNDTLKSKQVWRHEAHNLDEGDEDELTRMLTWFPGVFFDDNHTTQTRSNTWYYIMFRVLRVKIQLLTFVFSSSIDGYHVAALVLNLRHAVSARC